MSSMSFLSSRGDAVGAPVQLVVVRRNSLGVSAKEESGLFNLGAPICKYSIELRRLHGPEDCNPALDLSDLRVGENRHRGGGELTLVSLNGNSFPRTPLDYR